MKKYNLLFVLIFGFTFNSIAQDDLRSLVKKTENVTVLVNCAVDSARKNYIRLLNTNDTYGSIPVAKSAELILVDYPVGKDGFKAIRKKAFPIFLQREKNEYNFPIYYGLTGKLKKIIPELNDDTRILLSWETKIEISHELGISKEGDTLFFFSNYDGVPTGVEMNHNATMGTKEITSSLLGFYHGKNMKWKNGIKTYDVNYFDDRKEGQETTFYDDGTLKTQKNYVNNRLEGNSTTYYPDGLVREKLFYKDGKLDGYGEKYRENGNLELSMHNLNGVPNGEAKKFYPSGNVHVVMNFNNGQYDGAFVSYHANGKKESEGSYTNGAKTSEWKYWDENGNPVDK